MLGVKATVSAAAARVTLFSSGAMDSTGNWFVFSGGSDTIIGSVIFNLTRSFALSGNSSQESSLVD